MDIALNPINVYWNLLRFLSDDVKLELIAKLSNSLVSKQKEQKISASRFYGVWDDTDFDMSADEMNRQIKESRTFKDEMEAF